MRNNLLHTFKHSKTHKILTLVIEISELLMNTYKVPKMCLDVGN